MHGPMQVLQNDIILLSCVLWLFLKKFFVAVDCISWTAEMHIHLYASPSLSILPTGVLSVANYKAVSSRYIFDKLDAVAPYYVTARNEPLFLL
jgi:hypothetical protein